MRMQKFSDVNCQRQFKIALEKILREETTRSTTWMKKNQNELSSIQHENWRLQKRYAILMNENI